jgi:hypothetical protein
MARDISSTRDELSIVQLGVCLSISAISVQAFLFSAFNTVMRNKIKMKKVGDAIEDCDCHLKLSLTPGVSNGNLTEKSRL